MATVPITSELFTIITEWNSACSSERIFFNHCQRHNLPEVEELECITSDQGTIYYKCIWNGVRYQGSNCLIDHSIGRYRARESLYDVLLQTVVAREIAVVPTGG